MRLLISLLGFVWLSDARGPVQRYYSSANHDHRYFQAQTPPPCCPTPPGSGYVTEPHSWTDTGSGGIDPNGDAMGDVVEVYDSTMKNHMYFWSYNKWQNAINFVQSDPTRYKLTLNWWHCHQTRRAGSTPLYQLWYSSGNDEDHFLTTSWNEAHGAIQSEYYFMNPPILCYVEGNQNPETEETSPIPMNLMYLVYVIVVLLVVNIVCYAVTWFKKYRNRGRAHQYKVVSVCSTDAEMNSSNV